MLQNWWFKKEKPLFTGLHFGFGAGGGAAAEPSPVPISATGGSKSTLPNGNITHVFDSSGSFLVVLGKRPSILLRIDVLHEASSSAKASL